MKDKAKLLEQITLLAEISETLEPDCRAYCADESIPVADRWEVFQVAPNKRHKIWEDIPPKSEVGLTFSPYDDWYLERHETFDVVDRLNDWDDDEKYPADVIDKFKNYYMKSYTGSWIHDW